MSQTSIEQIKATKNGFDVLPDIASYAREGFAAIPSDHVEHITWYGMFHRKQTPGYVIQHLRLTPSIISSAQLRAIAGIAPDVGQAAIGFTTRYNIQPRWIEIEGV